jgi:hypothetical protein
MDEDVWVLVLLEKFNAGAMPQCRMLWFVFVCNRALFRCTQKLEFFHSLHHINF